MTIAIGSDDSCQADAMPEPADEHVEEEKPKGRRFATPSRSSPYAQPFTRLDSGIGWTFVLEPDLRVRADLLFTRAKVAIFIDGCFWHGCPDHFILPKHNAAWWKEKNVQEQVPGCHQPACPAGQGLESPVVLEGARVT